MRRRQSTEVTDQRPRLFVAVELPEEWKRTFGRLIEAMDRALEQDPRTAGTRLRWVRPEGIHLTLKFLGEVDSGQVPAIETALRDAVPGQPRFGLRLGRPGFFDARSPRVIWVGVEGAAQSLVGLAGQIDGVLAGLGFGRERRPFEPHLTLARLPEGMASRARLDIVSITNGVDVPTVPPFNVDQVSLMRSHLGPGGARYECLSTFPERPA